MTANTARYTSQRRAAIAAGTWRPRSDGAAAREHLGRLAAGGASVPEIAAAAGLAAATVRAAAGGARVAAATEAAILAVRPGQLEPRRPGAGGTALRLQALAAMGHTPTRVARAAGITPAYAREIAAGRQGGVPRETAAAVGAAYELLWDTVPPERSAADRRAAAAARHRAERQGWAAPMALDDERLDVPGYRPARRRWRQAEGRDIAPDLEAG
jgi:hypothetical protein